MGVEHCTKTDDESKTDDERQTDLTVLNMRSTEIYTFANQDGRNSVKGLKTHIDT